MTIFRNSILVLVIVGTIVYFAYKAGDTAELPEPKKIQISIDRIQTTPQTLPQVSTSTSIVPTPKPSQTQMPQSNQVILSTSVSYGVPGGNQSLTLKVTLLNNIVQNVVTTHSYGGKSKKYQQNFESVYKPYVIGKNISNISLSRIGGASLTTNAFNQAIASIRKSL